MITDFYIVPSSWTGLLSWLTIVYAAAMSWGFKRARNKYLREAQKLKDKTAELDKALERLQNDAAILSHEIEEVQKLKEDYRSL